MTYTQLGCLAVILAVLIDMFLLRTKLVTRKVFWVSYAIIVFFQLITNGMFTGFAIVRYDGAAIIGGTSPEGGAPPFIGDGRLAFAPVERDHGKTMRVEFLAKRPTNAPSGAGDEDGGFGRHANRET